MPAHSLHAVLLFASFFAAAQDKPVAAPPDPHKPLLDRLQAISEVPLPEWRYHAADLAHGEDALLDFASWPTVKQREDWTNGSRWVRLNYTVPDKLQGYDLTGSTIELDLHVASDETINVSVFSNGSLISRTDEDMQIPIQLTTNAQPGQKFAIAVRVLGNNVKTQIYRARLLIHAPANRPDPATLRMELLSARPVIDAYADGKDDREKTLAAAMDAIDVAALDKADQTRFDASLRESQQRLEALRPYLSQFTIHITGNSHIDMAWLWPWTETVEVVRNTFASALQLMREYPDLTFTMGSAQTYAWMEEKYPSLFEEIRQRVKEGRWEIVGGMWVEPDLNMPDGESLVRQILYGKRYFKQRFNVDVKIGWNPDSFGYNWQLPQIYKRSGLDYFVTQKIYWNDTTKFPHKLFWWQAPDGSKILTYFPHDYANSIQPEKMAKDLSMYAPSMWKADAGKNAAPPGQLEMMYLFGVSDHGGGPTREDLDTALQLRDPKVVFPKEEFGTAGAYFANLEKHLADLNIPTWKDELYFEYHRGVQTTQAETKRHNRKSEVMLLNAEKLASIASLYGEKYPKAGFETAWKDVLFNQFHDILPGSGIAVNYVDAARKDEQVQRFGREVVANSLRTISQRVDTLGPSVLVFNPLSWERTDVVEASVQLPNEIAGVSVMGPGGKLAAAEVLSTDSATNTAHVRFLATKVPSIGYNAYRIVNAPSAKPTTALQATPTSLENEFFRIVVDAKTGCITSVIDKANGAEALASPQPGDGIPAMNPDGKPCGNLLQVFVDKPKQWDAWNIDADFIKHHTDLLEADEVKLVEHSPLRAVIRVKKHFQNSTFEQDITMYAAVPRIDVNMRADWHEKHQLLKVVFPLEATNERATFEIPYGSIERPTTRRTPEEQAKFEVPALRWADLSNATQGFSLLNDSKYGYDAKNNVLRLSLLRAPEWPDPHADEGKHEFTYSLYPHAKDWKSAMTVHRGYELNYPLLTYVTSAHTGMLPATHSFFSSDANGTVITAIKQAEDGNDLLVRMYEWEGKPATVKLSLPAGATAGSATDLMEADDSTAPSTTIAPFEIKTVRVKVGGH